MRCRELAGVRIRHKCADCAKGQPNSVVASVMGATDVTDPLKLVRGGTDGLRVMAGGAVLRSGAGCSSLSAAGDIRGADAVRAALSRASVRIRSSSREGKGGVDALDS